jgi:hypothetical protein
VKIKMSNTRRQNAFGDEQFKDEFARQAATTPAWSSVCFSLDQFTASLYLPAHLTTR